MTWEGSERGRWGESCVNGSLGGFLAGEARGSPVRAPLPGLGSSREPVAWAVVLEAGGVIRLRLD